MGKSEKPIDVILALVKTLSKKDLERLKKTIGVKPLSACEERGHSYKHSKSYSPGFFGLGPPVVVMVCSKCGDRKVV